MDKWLPKANTVLPEIEKNATPKWLFQVILVIQRYSLPRNTLEPLGNSLSTNEDLILHYFEVYKSTKYQVFFDSGRMFSKVLLLAVGKCSKDSLSLNEFYTRLRPIHFRKGVVRHNKAIWSRCAGYKLVLCILRKGRRWRSLEDVIFSKINLFIFSLLFRVGERERSFLRPPEDLTGEGCRIGATIIIRW